MKFRFFLALTFLLALPLLAQDNSECFDCHDDPDLSNAAGKSLEVNEGTMHGSVHEDLDCIDCHEGGDFEEEPHWEDWTRVDCSECHDEVSNIWMERFETHLKRKNYEGEIPGCKDCHGTHQIRPDESRAENLCKRCHEEQSDQYHDSYHAQRHEGDSRIYPTCVTCHDPHFKGKKELMGATEYKQEIVLTCSQCHQKDIETYVHSTHYRRLEEDGDNRAPSCVDCHESHSIYKPTDPRSQVYTNNVSETCDHCHEGHRASLHLEEGQDLEEISCAFCHTGHQTDMVSINDRIFKEGGIYSKCNYCHSEHAQNEDWDILAHGRVMDSEEMGGEVNCTECHVYHYKVPDEAGNPRSSHEECKNCHAEVNVEYSKSIHGMALAAGVEESPSCEDCHGAEGILKPSEAFDKQGIVDLCSECHADKDLMLSFEINPYVVEGFGQTYHGKLYGLMTTDKSFAVCTNCHGYHGIRPPEDPESLVNREHLLDTCRTCHPKANENFISYLVHPIQPSKADLKEARENGLRHKGFRSINRRSTDAFHTVFETADRAMKTLFVVVIGFFGLHTILWFTRGIQPRLQKKKRYIRRFSPFERILHIMVNVSFLALAFTGLPQSYSHTTLGIWVFNNVMSLETAQWIHYAAALVTLLYFVLHLGGLLVKSRKIGWKTILSGPDSMVPRKKDFQDFLQHVKWFFGKGSPPSFDRWTYWEKFDYMAVFWGVAVIGISGLIRWNEEYFGNLLGGGVVSIADAIHKEEALLAAAFIFIVHFFNTHMRSEKFPMDVSIYTGLVSEEEFIEERPEQYKRLKETGMFEKMLRGPRPIWVALLSYAWGSFALMLGLWLLVLIIFGFLSGTH